MNTMQFLDEKYIESEQFPREFEITFSEVGTGDYNEVRVLLNNQKQLGDVINDNSHINDFYRYHDIFHYTFATLLGWSPCARAMMRRKRKSNPSIDRAEDGARAIIIEEAISMIIFNEAKKKEFFKNAKRVSKTTLRTIKEMTENLEVNIRSEREWEKAILKAYEVFRRLNTEMGGTVRFNLMTRDINYISLN